MDVNIMNRNQGHAIAPGSLPQRYDGLDGQTGRPGFDFKPTHELATPRAGHTQVEESGESPDLPFSPTTPPRRATGSGSLVGNAVRLKPLKATGRLYLRAKHNLGKRIALLSKHLVPNQARVKAIIAYQRSVNWLRYGDPHFPRAVAIEISVFCNRSCHYCPNSTNKTPKVFMSEEMFDVALRRLAEIRWEGIVDYNFYNEPTADDRLIEFVKKTREAVPAAMPRVITNGDYLTAHLAHSLIQAGVVNFSISRHYPVNDAWDRKMRGLLEEFGPYITLHRIWPREDLSNRGGEVKIENYRPISTCDAPAVALNILHNGDVILCCCDYKRRHVFGNIRQSGLLEIWRGPEFALQRNNVRTGNPQYEICKACFGKR